MKQIFVVNPHAGKQDRSTYITEYLKSIGSDAEVYVTQGPRDATLFVAERCRVEQEPLRFYACGGDGTLNEVISGVMGCRLQDADCRKSVEVGCYPCGSGNDYVKCWPDVDFFDLQAQLAAPSQEVDVMRLAVAGETRYCVNVMNYGFEAEVCRTMDVVRRWPLMGGRMSYVSGIVHCLLHKRHNPCRITVDGEAWHSCDILLGSAANGRYVGGGFQCAPRAVVDDGWLEALCVDALSVPRFLKLIGFYKRGEHLDRVEMHDVVHHRRVHSVVFEDDREFSIVVDGELIRCHRVEVECLPKAIKFVVPNKTTK